MTPASNPTVIAGPIAPPAQEFGDDQADPTFAPLGQSYRLDKGSGGFFKCEIHNASGRNCDPARCFGTPLGIASSAILWWSRKPALSRRGWNFDDVSNSITSMCTELAEHHPEQQEEMDETRRQSLDIVRRIHPRLCALAGRSLDDLTTKGKKMTPYDAFLRLESGNDETWVSLKQEEREWLFRHPAIASQIAQLRIDRFTSGYGSRDAHALVVPRGPRKRKTLASGDDSSHTGSQMGSGDADEQIQWHKRLPVPTAPSDSLVGTVPGLSELDADGTEAYLPAAHGASPNAVAAPDHHNPSWQHQQQRWSPYPHYHATFRDWANRQHARQSSLPTFAPFAIDNQAPSRSEYGHDADASPIGACPETALAHPLSYSRPVAGASAVAGPSTIEPAVHEYGLNYPGRPRTATKVDCCPWNRISRQNNPDICIHDPNAEDAATDIVDSALSRSRYGEPNCRWGTGMGLSLLKGIKITEDWQSWENVLKQAIDTYPVRVNTMAMLKKTSELLKTSDPAHSACPSNAHDEDKKNSMYHAVMYTRSRGSSHIT